MPPQGERLGVIILGGYRSGTSLTANLLAAAGAYVDNSIAADDRNPHGFFESRAVVEINRLILGYLGVTFKWVPKFEPTWPLAPKLNRYRERARRVVSELEQYPVWVMKDPRFSITLPFWLPLFDRPIRTVLCLRNPLDVVISGGESRRTTSLDLWAWYEYFTHAIRNTAGKPRFISCYESYFDSRRASQIAQLMEFVGLTPRVELESIVDFDLHRHAASLRALLNNDQAPDVVKNLYLHFVDCHASGFETLDNGLASHHAETQGMTPRLRSLFFRAYGRAWLAYRESPIDPWIPQPIRRVLIRTVGRWST